MRGLNSPHKYTYVKWFLEHRGIGLYVLLESRVRRGKFPIVFTRFGNRWSIATIYHILGGLA